MKLNILVLHFFLVSSVCLAGRQTTNCKKRGPFLDDLSSISNAIMTISEQTEIENRFETARALIEDESPDQYREIIDIVVNKPEVLNHVGQDKKTLLMLAAQHGVTELLEVFISFIEEETLFACDQDGCNALYLAELNEHQDAMKIIRQHHAYENSKPKKRMRM